MIEIECEEPIESVCDCCGNTTVALTRFVYQDGDAFAVYYAKFSENHPEREIKAAVSLGDWGEESKAEDRRAFALIIRDNDLQYEVTVVDANESPWRDVEIIGQMLNREEALNHPWIKDVFHISDHMVTDDPEIKAYFEKERL